MNKEMLPMSEIGQRHRRTSLDRIPVIILPPQVAINDCRLGSDNFRLKPDVPKSYATPRGRPSRQRDPVSGSGVRVPRSSNDDEDWNETSTVMTDLGSQPEGHSSTGGGTVQMTLSSGSEVRRKPLNRTAFHFYYRRYASLVITVTISAIALLSPIVMVCLPLAASDREPPETKACNPDCEGQLMAFSVKLFILLVGAWTLFFRCPQASVPRLSFYRSFVLFTVALLVVSFWLFYGVRILKPAVRDFRIIVAFANSLVDTLLFVHYLAVILLRVRSVGGQRYVVKIVRSPDGESRSYTFGQMSIQSLAVGCLQKYYRDFPIYHPNLGMIRQCGRENRKSSTEFDQKVIYRSDEGPGSSSQTSVVPGVTSTSDQATRKYITDDQLREWQNKVERRRSKLVLAAEEAFSRFTKLEAAESGETTTDAGSADAEEASRAIFTWIARPLHRYFRLTGALPLYPKDTILYHISQCICHGMSARSFLESYLRTPPVGLATDEDSEEMEVNWTLVSDQLVSSAVENSIEFELRRDSVRLLVTVRSLPYLNLTEVRNDTTRNRFVLVTPDGRKVPGKNT